MNTWRKSDNMTTGGAKILNSRGGIQGEGAMYSVSDQLTRRGILRGTAAAAMAAAFTR